MDFEKIKPAVEEIALNDIQKAKILNACKKQKRKFNFKPIVGIAAAAAVITLVLASPGFLFRASKADDEALENLKNETPFYDVYADVVIQDSVTTADFPLFEADEFTELYAVIPVEFSSLVDAEEYRIWSATVTADGGMAMAQFVLDFNIPREDFEKAIALYSERTFAQISDSADYFDADVIYSFDRETIDSFYKK